MAKGKRGRGEVDLLLEKHRACFNPPDRKKIEELISEVRDLPKEEKNRTDGEGKTAVAHAVSIEDIALRKYAVNALLEVGMSAHVYRGKTQESSPLIISLFLPVDTRSDEVVKLLLDMGAGIFTRVDKIGNSLFVAAHCGYIEAAKLILNQAKKEREHHPEVIKSLIDIGWDRKNQTVKSEAIKGGHPEFVKPYEEYLQKILGETESHSDAS